MSTKKPAKRAKKAAKTTGKTTARNTVKAAPKTAQTTSSRTRASTTAKAAKPVKPVKPAKPARPAPAPEAATAFALPIPTAPTTQEDTGFDRASSIQSGISQLRRRLRGRAAALAQDPDRLDAALKQLGERFRVLLK